MLSASVGGDRRCDGVVQEAGWAWSRKISTNDEGAYDAGVALEIFEILQLWTEAMKEIAQPWRDSR